MFFFIIWGTKSRETRHGVVGDYCASCRRVRAFTVYDLFTAPHVYYISLGGWTFRARVKQCWMCRGEFYARLKDYDDLIPELDAKRLSLRAIVERTNYPLADIMEQYLASRNSGQAG